MYNQQRFTLTYITTGETEQVVGWPALAARLGVIPATARTTMATNANYLTRVLPARNGLGVEQVTITKANTVKRGAPPVITEQDRYEHSCNTAFIYSAERHAHGRRNKLIWGEIVLGVEEAKRFETFDADRYAKAQQDALGLPDH